MMDPNDVATREAKRLYALDDFDPTVAYLIARKLDHYVDSITESEEK
jgi:hypothetical protein